LKVQINESGYDSSKSCYALIRCYLRLTLESNNNKNKIRGSSVGIATGYGLEYRGWRVRFPTRTGNLSFLHRVQTSSGASQPLIQRVLETFFPGVKRPVREADHSPPSSDSAKECVALYLHPQYVFMAWCLGKAQGLYFTITIIINSR
jgi:hypothetical protein